jgi:hypothetical protein
MKNKTKKSLGKVAEATVKKVNEEVWISPAEKTKSQKAVEVKKPDKPHDVAEGNYAVMGLIEAKVEAAAASRMWNRTVYIVQSKRDPANYYHVLDKEPSDFITFYRDGAERGEGAFKIHSKYNTPAKQKRAERTESIQADGTVKEKKPKVVRAKQPTVLEEKSLKLTDLRSLEQSCKAIIDKKEWVVQVRSGWCLVKSLVDQCKHGLIMVIKDQGYYLYPKSMWSEFDGIFKSNSYLNGGVYSQSVLPKKFDKYFKKF